MEEKSQLEQLAEFLGAPAEAANDPAVLRDWWDKAGSDTQAACPSHLIPPGW